MDVEKKMTTYLPRKLDAGVVCPFWLSKSVGIARACEVNTRSWCEFTFAGIVCTSAQVLCMPNVFLRSKVLRRWNKCVSRRMLILVTYLQRCGRAPCKDVTLTRTLTIDVLLSMSDLCGCMHVLLIMSINHAVMLAHGNYYWVLPRGNKKTVYRFTPVRQLRIIIISYVKKLSWNMTMYTVIV